MERIPPTQKAFAEHLGVNEATLWRWHNAEGFRAEVQVLIMGSIGDDLHDVMYAFKSEAKKGSYQHQKMFLELLGLYVERKEEKREGEMTIRIEHVNTDPNSTPA